MCYGYECKYYFVDEFENEEFCLNQENCSQFFEKDKGFNFALEGDNNFGRDFY